MFSANLILSPSPNVLASGSLLLSEPLAGHQLNERLNRAVNYVVNRPAHKKELDYVVKLFTNHGSLRAWTVFSSLVSLEFPFTGSVETSNFFSLKQSGYCNGEDTLRCFKIWNTNGLDQCSIRPLKVVNILTIGEKLIEN